MSIGSRAAFRLPGRALLLALSAPLVGGCFRAHRPAPVSPGAVWSTFQGLESRNAFEAERVSEQDPRILWRARTGRGLSAPPVVHGEVVYAVTTNRMVIALSAESGEIYWEHRKNGPFEVPPVVEGSELYVTTADVKGRVYALRMRDGRESWERKVAGVNVPLVSDGERLFLATEAGSVVALRLRDGEQLWERRIRPAAGAPVLDGERLIVGTIADSLLVLDASTGNLVGSVALPGSLSAPPAASGSLLYLPLSSGELVAVPAAGGEPVWRARLGGPVLAAPVLSRTGDVFALDRSGTVWRVPPDGRPERLTELGSAATGSLTLVENAVLVGLLDGRFVAVDRTDGSILWTLELGDSVTAPAVVKGGQIFIPLRRGAVVKAR